MDQFQLYTQYSGAVGKFGSDSLQALEIRDQHRDDREFQRFANAIDRLKRRVHEVMEQSELTEAADCEPRYAAAAAVGPQRNVTGDKDW